MSLVQLRDYQKLTLDRDNNVIAWWRTYRHPRGSLASVHRGVVPVQQFPLCLGARMPRAVCWHYKHRRWTLPLYKRTLAKLQPQIPAGLVAAFTCIHRYEGAWNSNTGNGYYGGMQMDYGFQRTYGPEFLARYGTADRWPISAQLLAAYRAYRARGFSPWPNTARYCGV